MGAKVPLIAPSGESLAYIAGFFDGEGCVNFTKSKGSSLVLRALVTNTSLEVLEMISEAIPGGTIVELKHGMSHWKRSYQLRYINHHAAKFVALLEPWLVVKAEQAIVAMSWSAMREIGPALSDDAKEAYRLLERQLSWLNKKGPDRDLISPIDIVIENNGLFSDAAS